MVYTLAKGRVTPQVEHWVLWELPLARALAYHHCSLRSAGQHTIPAGDRPLDESLRSTGAAVQRAIEAQEIAESERGGDDFDD